MTADVHAALEETVQRRAERDRLAARSQALRTDLQAAAAALSQAGAGVEDEAVDVHHLESFSPIRIWAALRGRLDTDLDREKAELEQALYVAAEAQRAHDELDRALAANEADLGGYAGADTAYDVALAAKDELLRNSGGPEAAELASIGEQRGLLRSRTTELEEAVAAAVAALERLGAAEHHFAGARSWSNWDTFGGGGLLTDMVKYDRIDQAKASLREAVGAVGTLSRELADVGIAAIDRSEVDGFTRGFDVWFDNFFSDFSVRNRVVEAHDRVRQLLEQVDQVRVTLQGQLSGVRKQLAELDARRTAVLTTSGPLG